MLVTDVGSVTLVKELHPEKAPPPMLVTDVGSVTLVKELHCWKAQSPMLVTDVGMSTLVTFLLSTFHPAHEPTFIAYPPVMLMVPSGMAKCTNNSADVAAAAASAASTASAFACLSAMLATRCAISVLFAMPVVIPERSSPASVPAPLVPDAIAVVRRGDGTGGLLAPAANTAVPEEPFLFPPALMNADGSAIKLSVGNGGSAPPWIAGKPSLIST